jgi:thiamine biosynthesis lipoprotein
MIEMVQDMDEASEFSIRKPLFGKDVEIVIYGIDDELAKEVADKAYEEGLRLSRIFNLYDEKSELSSLNRNRIMRVSDELISLLNMASGLYDLTCGKYDVSLGKAILQRKAGLAETARCSFKDVIIEGNIVTLSNDDVMIDLGSIAKGFIVDKMVEILESEGVLSGLVDGRGDMRIFGERAEIIGIQHPRDKERLMAKINVKDCSIATSGDYNQYFGSFERSHIINSSDLASITVVGQNLAISDAFATAFFVSKNTALLEKYKDLKVMTIDKDMGIRYYNEFEKLLC